MKTATAGALLLLAGTLAGCGGATAAASNAAHSTTPAAQVRELSAQVTGRLDPAVARKRLERLPVKGRASKAGYDRDEFGTAWADTDHNGCDTRNDILKRDLSGETFKSGRCVVATGTLRDPYSGRTIRFVRGPGTSNAVQIDHVVALSDAWQKGAQGLDEAKREQLANDPLNLLAVDGPLNQAKSDSDAATWLPPVKGYRCQYVARQIAVKAKYRLWVTTAEHDAMKKVLDGC